MEGSRSLRALSCCGGCGERRPLPGSIQSSLYTALPGSWTLCLAHLSRLSGYTYSSCGPAPVRLRAPPRAPPTIAGRARRPASRVASGRACAPPATCAALASAGVAHPAQAWREAWLLFLRLVLCLLLEVVRATFWPLGWSTLSLPPLTQGYCSLIQEPFGGLI